MPQGKSHRRPEGAGSEHEDFLSIYTKDPKDTLLGLQHAVSGQTAEKTFGGSAGVITMPILFMLSQSLSALPALVPGTTVMVVADDLRTIYSRGVVEGNTLRFDAPLPAGSAVQLLFYPPAAAGSAAEAGATDGLQSLRASAEADGRDLLVLEGSSAVSFRQWLSDRHGIVLLLPGD